jgi:cell division protein FtsQ
MSTRTGPALVPPGRSRAPSKVDPRIRERRTAVTRARGRRRLRVLVAIAVASIVAGLAWLVLHSTLLDVDRVVVRGAVRTSPRDVRSAAEIDHGDALVFVDLSAVSRRVERLPWVDEARVERQLPGELAILVTERSPVAWARRSEAEVALLDARGRVLAVGPDTPPSLPELTGLAAVPPPGRRVAATAGLQALGELPGELRAKVTRVTMGGGELALGLDVGPEIRMGASTELGEKGRVALAILRTLQEPFPAYLDVGAPGAPVTG